VVVAAVFVSCWKVRTSVSGGRDGGKCWFGAVQEWSQVSSFGAADILECQAKELH
jgi:hypothetical protein